MKSDGTIAIDGERPFLRTRHATIQYKAALRLPAGSGRWVKLFALGFLLAAPPALAAPFDDSLADLLSSRCLRCHSGTDPKGGLNLSTLAGMLQGGDNGPAIQIHNAAESLLIKRVAEGSMPPIGDGDALAAAEVTALRMWIQSGAIWPADLRLQPNAAYFTAGQRCARVSGPRTGGLQVRGPETRAQRVKVNAVGLQPAALPMPGPQPLTEDRLCPCPNRILLRSRPCDDYRRDAIPRRPRIKSNSSRNS